MYADIYNALVQDYLSKVASEGVELSEDILNEFAENCKQSLVKAFSGARKTEEFRLRMSNIGRPTCQLQMEKAGAEAEPFDYNFPIKMAMGHLTEALLIAVLRSANFNLHEVNSTGSAEIAGQRINGEIDLCIDGKVWDAKSASGKSFFSKFVNGGITPDKDDFGYLGQGLGYSKAMQKPFGGWIAINKETGEICFAPYNLSAEDEARVEAKVADTITRVSSDAEFERCFEDEAETYYSKETGNRILGRTCGYCQFKKTCWPEAKYLPRQVGRAQNPEWFWYTYVKESEDE